MASFPKLYQKSILFEIVNIRNPSEIVSAFTLTIPPDAIEITQGQRVTRTKTFGGMFIDDYGLDVARITISGSTGNSDLRATYIPGRGGMLEQYTGKTAIYAFRDRIVRYKNLLAGKDFESYEMRLYDLSTAPDASKLDSVQDSTTDGWVVSLDDFKIQRSKERPLWYNYTIELIGLYPLPSPRRKVMREIGNIPSATGSISVRDLGDELIAQPDIKVPTTKEWLKDAVGALRRTLNAIKGAYAWTKNVLNEIDNAFKLVDDLEGFVVEYIHASGQIITEGFGFYSKIFEIAHFPAAIAIAVMKEINNVMQTIEDQMEYTANLSATLGDDYDYIMLSCEEAKRIVAQIVVFGKSPAADSEVTVQVAGKTITIYGTITVIADESTTLEKLAAQYYGDPSMALLIAMYNGITNEDIVSGMTIKIPQTTRTTRALDNRVYSWDRASNYGTDIRLDPVPHSVKMVIAESGDFAYISGKQNLIQAINLRLSERLGKRLRLTVYGLAISAGAPRTNVAPISYILSNLRDTLQQDPRIKAIDTIKLRGLGDQLYVSFNAHAVGDSVSYEGVL